MTTIAFDVYGTLIDPLAIRSELAELIGERAPDFAARWRDKQLEYSFRRGLMRAYADFSTCTAQALQHTCALTGVELDEASRIALLNRYRELPAFDEVPAALHAMRSAGHALYAFSNGTPADLDALLEHAGVRAVLDGVVSVHPVGSFKPDPAVYAHFCSSVGRSASQVLLVSSNPFDVTGARAAGWAAAWIRRDSRTPFDPWEFQPTMTHPTLQALADAV